MRNEVRRQRCHGADSSIRGVIEVTLDTTREQRERRMLERLAILFACGTIVFVVLVLWVALRFTVLRPVGEIGTVADRVGEGMLDVVLGAMGSEQRMDFTVIGDAVNVAARLCSAAGPGQVLVSLAARSAIAGAPDGIELAALPPIQVKGKTEPISVFEARRS